MRPALPIARSHNGASKPLPWQPALQYCADLDWGGHTDWLLPDVKALFSIVNGVRYEPAIDSAIFPNTPDTTAWSSTTQVGSPEKAWTAGFANPSVGGFGTAKSNHFAGDIVALATEEPRPRKVRW